MPPKGKTAKHKKNGGCVVVKRDLVEVEEGQVYGIVEKALGSLYFTVKCFDDKTRRCKLRNQKKKKMKMKITVDSVVIVSLREFDAKDSTGDIIYKYEPDEVRQLQKEYILPSFNVVNTDNTDDPADNNNMCPFDFESI